MMMTLWQVLADDDETLTDDNDTLTDDDDTLTDDDDTLTDDDDTLTGLPDDDDTLTGLPDDDDTLTGLICLSCLWSQIYKHLVLFLFLKSACIYAIWQSAKKVTKCCVHLFFLSTKKLCCV